MAARKKKPAKGSVGLAAPEVGAEKAPANIEALAAQVGGDGGIVLTMYRDPFAGQWVLFCALPLEKVEPTPYQRELSDTHAKRLAGVIPKVGRFLDPVIATRHEKGYWTPNGMHRLEALKMLGARSITALLLPEPEIAYRILALNTEKAHNLKDKSLEVIRMAQGLAADSDLAKKPISTWAFEFEEPAYLAIGSCYLKNKRFSGSAYLPVVKRCVEFNETPLKKVLEQSADQAADLLKLDEAVNETVARLKAAGLQTPYLKPFVVARINPLRWIKAPKPGQKAPRADFYETMKKMLDGAKKLDASKIKPSDLAASAGGGGSAED